MSIFKNDKYEFSIDDKGITLLEISMSNMKNMVHSDSTLTPNKMDSRNSRTNEVQIVNYMLVPSISNKELTVTAKIKGKTGNYNTSISFQNVLFSNENKPGYIEILAIDGKTYFVKQQTHAQASVKVTCSCLDFYYRFAIHNHGKKALRGDPPPPYVKKTDRPLVNPGEIAGICKHLNKLGRFLISDGIIK